MIDFDLRVKSAACKENCLFGESYWVIFVRLLTKAPRKCEPICFIDSRLLPDHVLAEQSIFSQESLLVNSAPIATT